jgi:alanine dehydrogenase
VRIGVPAEVKLDEHRVGLTPTAVAALTSAGHMVTVEAGAGLGAGHSDSAYVDAGATLGTPSETWETELVVKVKEPQQSEYAHFRPGLLLFTYLHLAAAPELTHALLATGVTGIGYETVRSVDGRLPLLRPMSEIAGRLAPQMAAFASMKPMNGQGVLLGGTPGVAPSCVVIVGGGSVGENAAVIASGMRADVWLLDISVERVRSLDERFAGQVRVAVFDDQLFAQLVERADVIIGAVLSAGARAAQLLTQEDLARMKPGSVLVDVAIDQGGCFETSRPTTHRDPTYVVDGINHYCVANMPGAVPVTSTAALGHATYPYVRRLADDGINGWLNDPLTAAGVNTMDGRIVCNAVAAALSLHP